MTNLRERRNYTVTGIIDDTSEKNYSNTKRLLEHSSSFDEHVFVQIERFIGIPRRLMGINNYYSSLPLLKRIIYATIVFRFLSMNYDGPKPQSFNGRAK